MTKKQAKAGRKLPATDTKKRKQKPESGMTFIGDFPKDHSFYQTNTVYVGFHPPDRVLTKPDRTN